MAAPDRHRGARFQLRLDAVTLETLKRKAAARSQPLNQYIAEILERSADDTGAYHQAMSAKHSFMSYALLNVLAAQLLPQGVRKEVFATIGEQGHRLFGANPEVPDAIIENASNRDSAFTAELFDLIERHASNHWKIRAD